MNLRGNLTCIKLIFKTVLYLSFLALFLHFYFIEQFLEYLKGRTTYSTAIDIRSEVDFPSILVCVTYRFDLINQNFNDSHPFTILSKPLNYQYQNNSHLDLYYWLSYFNFKDFNYEIATNDLVNKQVVLVPSEAHSCLLISTNATNQNPIEQIGFGWKKFKPPFLRVYIVPNEGWQEKILDEWRYTKPFEFLYQLTTDKITQLRFSLSIEETKMLEHESHFEKQEDRDKCILTELSKFNCPSICLPLLFSHISELNICSSSSDFKCMNDGIRQKKSTLLDKCFASKNSIQYKGEVDTYTRLDGNNDITEKYKSIIHFNFTPISNRVLVKEERYILSTTDFIGSVGGSLGLFLGFSCFTYTSDLLDKLLNKLSSLL